ncbi:M23 family metallopeptidase [Virgibacillus oceani]
MKSYLAIFLAICLSFSLSACSEGQNDSLEDQEEVDEEMNAKLVSPGQFTDQFLEGELERLYNQTSEDFQATVTLEEFVALGENFNAGVESFDLVSEIPIHGMTEYQWVSNQGDKGIRSYFADDLTIEGLQLMPISDFPESDENYTENTYRMPITEAWYTFWGGTNELVNYHYSLENQRYAYDLLMMEGDATFDGDLQDNESYFAFGKEVAAPLDGLIVSAENNIADNTPNVDTNEEQLLGNHVIIEHDNDEYSVIGHLKEGSLQVSEGDNVTAGELVGLAGNSGNSSEPHIHFHVADSPDWENAASIRIKFEDGEEPVRGETITGF